MTTSTAPRKPGVWRRILMILVTGRDPATFRAPMDVRSAHELKLENAEARLAALDSSIILQKTPLGTDYAQS